VSGTRSVEQQACEHILTHRYGPPVMVANTDETDKVISWNTKCGVSFYQVPSLAGFLFCYKYEDELGPFLKCKNKKGVILFKDVMCVVAQLVVNPQKLRTKPVSVQIVESATGAVGYLKENAFGKWHVNVGHASMFCNPFGTELGYTRFADEWEIWYRDHEENPRERQSTPDVLRELKAFGYMKSCGFCPIGGPDLLRCGKCKQVYYCSKCANDATGQSTKKHVV
jgi:hypothetical protein